ncbi:hypothetical protein GIB67_009753 [Kingdonia uniflora]|uniref:Uncharacterized protein n=1 Tax=Kingdonia uniflora TaxID=39325 RepID=A0A7J7LB64_9MAGN|nr:hypothetical protein GIB67_009753 [Kingdonia uniflora]
MSFLKDKYMYTLVGNGSPIKSIANQGEFHRLLLQANNGFFCELMEKAPSFNDSFLPT